VGRRGKVKIKLSLHLIKLEATRKTYGAEEL
jgi:hypothetical protein